MSFRSFVPSRFWQRLSRRTYLTATDSVSMVKQNHDSCMWQTVRLKQQKSGASLGENSRRKMMSTSSIRAGS